ncbi:hypothetical protein X963_4331 [Burkholderia pseudomallei MSHR7498]|nr:hypothetical protein X963_4331 [Burkholderia pseudomallei MSHR7498]
MSPTRMSPTRMSPTRMSPKRTSPKLALARLPARTKALPAPGLTRRTPPRGSACVWPVFSLSSGKRRRQPAPDP